jgi:hypothetical protein
VTDKLWLVVLECGRSKDVIGVDVGHHYVLDRELSRPSNGCAQTLAIGQASAWVYDRYRVAADDEPDVGYGVIVLWRHVFIHATSDVNPWCNFVRGKRTRVHRGFLRERSDAEKARACE